MIPLTEPNLQNAGYRRFEWNNGMMLEYWKPLTESTDMLLPFSRRLCVRLGELPGNTTVYIVSDTYYMFRACGVKSVGDLELLRKLLIDWED